MTFPWFDPKTCHVVTAWCERSTGPGWANSLVWILIRRNDDKGVALETHALQPEEQSDAMRLLFGVAHAAHVSLTQEAVHHLSGSKAPRKAPPEPVKLSKKVTLLLKHVVKQEREGVLVTKSSKAAQKLIDLKFVTSDLTIDRCSRVLRPTLGGICYVQECT